MMEPFPGFEEQQRRIDVQIGELGTMLSGEGRVADRERYVLSGAMLDRPQEGAEVLERRLAIADAKPSRDWPTLMSSGSSRATRPEAPGDVRAAGGGERPGTGRRVRRLGRDTRGRFALAGGKLPHAVVGRMRRPGAMTDGFHLESPSLFQ
jgi:hypothetical protein